MNYSKDNHLEDNHLKEILIVAATWAFWVFSFSIGLLLAQVTF